MKVLLVNTYSSGGAAVACIRLHEGLLRIGVESNLLFMNYSAGGRVMEKVNVFEPQLDRKGFLKRALKKFFRLTGIDRSEYELIIKKQIRKQVPGTIEWFSFPDSGIDISNHPLFQEADIINIHWVADFIDLSFFKNNKKPVVWTLHDMNAFTGGCHYSGGCTKYLSGCAVCPQLSDCDDDTFSGRNFRIKRNSLKSVNNFHIVSPSGWLADLSAASPLLGKYPHYHIPNGTDETVFKPEEQKSARQKLNLPVVGKIILFIANDLHTKRKGYELLKAAFEKLESDYIILCSVGRSGSETINNATVIELGEIRTEKEMSLVYSAADLFVIPSLEENLPNTVIEALLCGLPVAGFPVGGIPEMITDGVNGLLTNKADVDDLVVIIQSFLAGKYIFDRTEIRNNAIQKFGISIQVKAYKSLYEKILIEQSSQKRRHIK